MANVPGVLILGGYSVQGDSLLNSFVSSLGVSDLGNCKPDKPMRVVPDNPTTGAPTAASLGWYPWFDGAAGDTLYTVLAGAGASTVTVSGSPGWTVNQWAGKFVTTINPFGLGFSNRALVASNTTNQLTISGTWTSTPAAGVGLFLGQGRWRDYHPCAGWLAPPELGASLSTRGGSSWAGLGLGIGVDAGLIRELLEHVYPSSPYFQVAKFAFSTPTTSAFDSTTGSTKAAFVAEVARYNAAWTALANGNTLAWDLVVLDNSQTDVIDWATNPTHYLTYEAALTQTIAYLRTTLGNANLRVVIVNHAIEKNNVTAPTGTALANRIHRSVAAAGANIRCASMEGQPLCLATPYVPSQNKGAYEAGVYWGPMARIVRQTYERLIAGTPPAYAGGVPVYLLFGDSTCVGPIQAAYLTSLDSPTLTVGPRDSRQGIYNKGNGAAEPYDLGDNSNTSGSVTFGSFGGVECSMLVALQDAHPETGCIVLKRGSNSSSLIALAAVYSGGGESGGRWSKSYSGTEHYGQLLADFAGLCSYVNRTLGQEVDLRGAFVLLGTNDQAIDGGGALFAAELATFVADVRTDFSTRTSGADLPFVWRVPNLASASAAYDEAVTVRAAIVDYAATDAQFVALNCDDLERSAADGIHDTPDAAITVGQRMVAAMLTIAN